MSAPEQQLHAEASRSRWSELSGGAFLAMALGLVALCVAVVGLYLPGNNGDSNRTTSAPVAASPAAAPAQGAFGAKPTTVLVSLGDLFVKPNKLSANAGDHVVLNVRNTGKLEHDLQLHVELQGSNDHDMPLRMLEYYTLLWRRYRKPVRQVDFNAWNYSKQAQVKCKQH